MGGPTQGIPLQRIMLGATLVVVVLGSRNPACRVPDGTVASVNQALVDVQMPLASTTGHEIRAGDATFTCYVYDVKAGRLWYSDGKPVVDDPFLADVLREARAGSEPSKRWAIAVHAVSQRPFAGYSYLSLPGLPRHAFFGASCESDNAYRLQFATIDLAALRVDHVDVRCTYALEWNTIGTYDIATLQSQGVRFHPRLKLFGLKRSAGEPWAQVHVRMKVWPKREDTRIVAVDRDGKRCSVTVYPGGFFPWREFSGKDDRTREFLSNNLVRLELQKAVPLNVEFRNVVLGGSRSR